ncbi:hypothetical protein [Flavobacterium sp.]|uniref:hypothetical protein n=1 Tax=Flavobacterium sp. TaxID=239 RepID=UPI0037501B74
MTRNEIILKNFNGISLVGDGVILKFKFREQKEIPFSDIDKIYIQANKIPAIYIFLFIIFSLIGVLLSLWFFGFELVAISPLLLFFILVVRLNNYKRYVMKINLKNGNSVIQQIPLKFKHKTIEDINIIRKELFLLQ